MKGTTVSEGSVDVGESGQQAAQPKPRGVAYFLCGGAAIPSPFQQLYLEKLGHGASAAIIAA